MQTPDIYSVPVTTISGEQVTLAPFKGKVMLIVNVASRCGLTPQYSGLQQLYSEFQGQGLEVLGFPCNQFAGQEPGTEAEIATFCDTNYQVRFPLFAKVEVNGPGTHPLYKMLKQATAGGADGDEIKWNFGKFLVSRSGAVLKRYAPTETPESLHDDIAKALAAKN